MITDGQVHLWDKERPEWPWAPGEKVHLDEPFTVEKMLALMDDQGVDRAVTSQPAILGYDPAYPIDCVRRFPDRIAIMGRYDPDDPASLAKLETWLDMPGMIALRLSLTAANWPRWRNEGTLDPFWTAAERLQIPVGIFAQIGLAGVRPVIERHPDLLLTVDHLNFVGTLDGGKEERLAELLDLARFPNVTVKVSALPMQTRERYPFTELHEPLRRVHAAFGPDRMIWGADQSMAIAHHRANYQENLDLMRVEMARYFTPDDLRWILSDSIAKWWRWPGKREERREKREE